MSTWTKALGAAVLVMALAGACSSEGSSDSSTRDESGNITEGGDVGVFRLNVGDCFDQPPDGNVTEVAGIPCEQAHDNEVFAKFDIEGGDDAPFPGDASVQSSAQDGCTGDRFTEYVGVSFQESKFQATSLNPTQDSWEQGDDREVICIATTGDGSKITGSIQGTNQ